MSSDDIYNRPRGPWAKIQGVLVGVLVGMLVLAFAVWGIEDVFRPNSSGAVVKVGDSEVPRAEFQDRFNTRMEELARELGEGLTNQQAYDRGIPQQLAQRMQSDLAIEQDAEDLGIGVNNRDVRAYVETIEAFRNPITGEFDESLLESGLQNARITRSQFEEDVVRALTQQQTLPAIIGGIRAPRDYALRYNDFVNEIRRIRVLQLTEDTLSDFTPPTEDEVRAFVTENAERYTAPEYRRVLMLRIDPQDFAGNDPADARFADADAFPEGMFDVYVTEEQVREQFDLLVSTGQIGAPETRDVTVLSAPDADVAELVATRLRAGETPQAIADDLDLGAPSVFTGLETDGLINPRSSEVAFELEEGAVGTADTDFGSVEVIRVDRVEAADVPDFEASRDDIQRDLILGEAVNRISDLEETVDDALLEGRTLEEIAETIGFPVQAYPFIDRRGTTPDGVTLNGFQRLPGIAQDPDLLNAIFAELLGRESEILPTANNGIAVFRVVDVIDPAPRPFEEVRQTAETVLRLERVDAALTELGRDVERRLRDGEDIDAVASQLGVEVRETAVQRANPPRNISPQLLVRLLEGEPGAVARGAGAQPGTYEVGVLDSVSGNSERIGGQLLQEVQNNLSEQIALDISQAYTQAILNEHESAIYEDQIRTALALEDAG